jgi:hypothetical protein
MISVYNGTQHEINIFDLADTYSIQDGRKLVLKPGATALATIAPGKNLNCIKSNSKNPTFEVEGLPSSVLKGAVNFVSCDPLPEEAIGKVVIVSNLYRSAYKELNGDSSLLATVNGTVYESEDASRPCGCLGLAIG